MQCVLIVIEVSALTSAATAAAEFCVYRTTAAELVRLHNADLPYPEEVDVFPEELGQLIDEDPGSSTSELAALIVREKGDRYDVAWAIKYVGEDGETYQKIV